MLSLTSAMPPSGFAPIPPKATAVTKPPAFTVTYCRFASSGPPCAIRLTLRISRPENSAAEFGGGVAAMARPIRARQPRTSRAFFIECLRNMFAESSCSFASDDFERRDVVNTTQSSGVTERHGHQQRTAGLARNPINSLWRRPALRELPAVRHARQFFFVGPGAARAADQLQSFRHAAVEFLPACHLLLSQLDWLIGDLQLKRRGDQNESKHFSDLIAARAGRRGREIAVLILLRGNVDQASRHYAIVAAARAQGRENEHRFAQRAVHVLLAIDDVKKSGPRRFDGDAHAIADVERRIRFDSFGRVLHLF